MKPILTAAIAILSTIMLSASSYASVANVSEAKAQELTNLKAVLQGNVDNVFFIRIFGNELPIPNRFMVNHGLHLDNPTIRYAAPAFVASTIDPTTNRIRTDKNILGEIIMGRYSKDVDEEYKTDEAKIETFEKYGLRFRVITTRGYPGKSAVIVTDEKEYIVIMDSNDELWKVAFEVYAKLAEEKKAVKERIREAKKANK